jgi:uncharacterized protein with GYD domain
MATFVVLSKWSQKTFEAIKDAPAIIAEIEKFVADMGAEIKGWYMVMGQYDEIWILEAPDAETVAKILIPLGAKYGDRTETLRAFSLDEALKLIGAL